MDLTKQVPRSPNDMMAGIVSLPRMIDKTQANAEGTLGEYDVDCPHDKPVLALLGVDFATFAAKLKELNYDNAKVEAWARTLLAKKTPAELNAFNDSRRNWKPDDHSQGYFDKLKAEVAPDRPDVTTWFKLLDLDEKRAA
jgi:Domain of unknown function (DUF5069)